LSNADALAALKALRSDVLSGQVGIEVAQAHFERLTYLLTDVSSTDERALVALVNDIERIRFGRLPENQPTAIAEVFARAEQVFERCL
jgi:hypothetical protein